MWKYFSVFPQLIYNPGGLHLSCKHIKSQSESDKTYLNKKTQLSFYLFYLKGQGPNYNGQIPITYRIHFLKIKKSFSNKFLKTFFCICMFYVQYCVCVKFISCFDRVHMHTKLTCVLFFKKMRKKVLVCLSGFVGLTFSP